MTGQDDEFDEFLTRKRPLFRRPTDDEIEPPNDVDRLVLRQARDAIKPAEPERMYRGPGWGVPLAVAATLLVCLSMVLHVVMPKKAVAPEGTTQQVAQQVDAAPAAVAPADAPADGSDSAANNLPPPPPPMAASRGAASPAAAESMASDAAPTAGAPTAAAPAAAPADAGARVAGASNTPWRGDARSWLAEIERLRAEGKAAEADAELALYKREHRAYASGPDR